MRSVPRDRIVRSSAETLISELKAGSYSILKSLDANKLRLEMLPVGLACRIILWIILRAKKNPHGRAQKLLDFFFPTTLRVNNYRYDWRKKHNTAIVLYFNHQSLLEVIGTINYCFKNFTDKRFLFPVNLPWYECLIPVADKLAQLNIDIVPLITPTTYDKLISRQSTKSDQEAVNEIKYKFDKYYFALADQYILISQLVAIAPSATRVPTIFNSKEAYHSGNDKHMGKKVPRPISMVVISAQRMSRLQEDPIEIDFVPIVFTHKGQIRRGLNIGRHHDIYVGRALTLRQMENLRQQKKVDFVARRKLADFLPDHIKYPPQIADF